MARLFDGKVGLVTGCGFGIGLASAVGFTERGARVVVSDVNPTVGEAVVRVIRETGGEATFVQADVTQAAQVEALVATTVQTYGRLDFAHNNAGIQGKLGPLHECPEE